LPTFFALSVMRHFFRLLPILTWQKMTTVA